MCRKSYLERTSTNMQNRRYFDIIFQILSALYVQHWYYLTNHVSVAVGCQNFGGEDYPLIYYYIVTFLISKILLCWIHFHINDGLYPGIQIWLTYASLCFAVDIFLNHISLPSEHAVAPLGSTVHPPSSVWIRTVNNLLRLLRRTGGFLAICHVFGSVGFSMRILYFLCCIIISCLYTKSFAIFYRVFNSLQVYLACRTVWLRRIVIQAFSFEVIVYFKLIPHDIFFPADYFCSGPL